eukprot:782341-Pelagomonas_calceolata.AAC.3
MMLTLYHAVNRAGYGSAKSLLAAGVEEVVVLDASQNPGGLASTSTNGTTIIEPGIKVPFRP